MEQHHVYLISGLGANHRIFENLRLENAQLHEIPYEIPARDDTMASYALRLSRHIHHQKIVLIGMSYGGMLAIEIARQLAGTVDVQKLILISSAKGPAEFPGFLKQAARLKLYKLAPYWLLRTPLNRFVFDSRSSPAEIRLKREMLATCPLSYLSRSVRIILQWKPTAMPSGLVHIHGTSDQLFLPYQVAAHYWIQGGDHFMVWNKAEEISGLINRLLQNE